MALQKLRLATDARTQTQSNCKREPFERWANVVGGGDANNVIKSLAVFHLSAKKTANKTKTDDNVLYADIYFDWISSNMWIDGRRTWGSDDDGSGRLIRVRAKQVRNKIASELQQSETRRFVVTTYNVFDFRWKSRLENYFVFQQCWRRH